MGDALSLGMNANTVTDAVAYVAIHQARLAYDAPAVKDPMLSSAKLCIDDAVACLDRGQYSAARDWALRSLAYTVGRFSDVYRRVEELT